MSITSLAHVCIRTTDLEKTRHFYSETLGMPVQFRFTKNGKVIGLYLKASDRTFLEFFLVGEARESKNDDRLSHFCLETDDIESLHATLVRAGYEPGKINLGADIARQFWVTDPNGIRFEFHQYSAESSQFTGRDVEVNW
jgi:catechol 2,3-dioxygenase-like lactoylglutathione lyase family enzyme